MTPCEKWLQSNGWPLQHRCDCNQSGDYKHCSGCNEILDCFDTEPGKAPWCSHYWDREEKRLLQVERDELKRRLAETEKKLDEYRQEARRCRRIVKALLDGLDTEGCVFEIYQDKESNIGVGIVVCAPNLNEENLAPAMKVVMEDFWAAVTRKREDLSFGKMRVTGTESDQS